MKHPKRKIENQNVKMKIDQIRTRNSHFQWVSILSMLPTSEWTALHSKSPAKWLGISHTASSFLLSAKSHACCGYALVNAGMTPPLRYQLFAAQYYGPLLASFLQRKPSLNIHNAAEHSYVKEQSERAAPFLVYPAFPTRYSISMPCLLLRTAFPGKTGLCGKSSTPAIVQLMATAGAVQKPCKHIFSLFLGCLYFVPARLFPQTGLRYKSPIPNNHAQAAAYL